MSNQLFALILSGRNYHEVLNRAAQMSLADQELAAKEVRDEEIADIATYIVTACQTIGVQQTLIFGGLLHLFALVVQPEGRRELFDNMLEDLGVSRTQAFRCRAAWNCFGAEFLQDTSLHRFFCAESLKILSEERTPEEAREAAVELARNGERITMKRARALQKKYGIEPVANVPSPARTNSSRSVSRRWQFAGVAVRIQLTPTSSTGLPDAPVMISDLEAAISELKSVSATPRIA